MENLHPATFSGSLVLCTAIGLHIARRQLTLAPRHTSGEETHGRRTGLGARRDKWRQWWILPIPFYYWQFPSVFERFWSILSISLCFQQSVPLPLCHLWHIRRNWTTSIKTHRVQTLQFSANGLWDKRSFAHLLETIFPTESPMNFTIFYYNFINRKQSKKYNI